MNERVWAPITISHLEILKHVALDELKRFLNEAGTPQGKYSVYKNRLIAVCLCQGAAQYFFELWLMGKEPEDKVVEVKQKEIEEKSLKVKDKIVLSGIKDIDIWFFFEEHPEIEIPHIRNMRKSIILEIPGLGKRRIDFMKKMIAKSILENSTSIEEIIRKYLALETNSARFLSEKSIIGVYPEKLFAKPIWKVKRIISNKPLQRTGGYAGR